MALEANDTCPEFIGPDDLSSAVVTLESKDKTEPGVEVKLEDIAEGQCVQMLHLGPYDQGRETIKLMADFASDRGVEFHGRHHEFYLSDPRRVPPERLRTILRLPVRPR